MVDMALMDFRLDFEDVAVAVDGGEVMDADFGRGVEDTLEGVLSNGGSGSGFEAA